MILKKYRIKLNIYYLSAVKDFKGLEAIKYYL
jgi:hypothetical protein